MTDHTPTPDTMCTCGHGAASAHDIDNSVSAFTACVVSGCTCKAFTPAPEAATRAVRGYCPACGWATLFLGDGGYVTCAHLDCPAPDAASTLLETDPRTTPGAPATNPCRARTASDVLVQHDVTRKAMCDALDIGYHLNWQQIIDTAQRSHTANTEWQREDEEHRTAVSDALGLGTGAGWDAITDRARQVTADLDAARAGDAPWIRAYREDLEDAKKHAKEAEATIARVRDAVVQWRGWNPTENAWAIRDIEHALSGDPDPRPQDPAALDGEQPAAGPERCFVCGAPAVINQVVDRRYLCGDCFLCRCGESPCVRTGVNDPAVSAEPEKPCFHPSWETEPTVGARRCTDCGEWLDPQPTPVELDGAALWAAIRDHAFNDTQWWRKVNQRQNHAQLNTYVQRGPGHTPTR